MRNRIADIADKGVGSQYTPWSWPWIKVRASRHSWDMFKLSVPIIISRMAMMLMVFVDTILSMRYSPEQAKWLALAIGPVDMFFAACIGFTVGVPVLISRHYGAKEYKEIGKVWRQGIVIVNIAGLVFGGLCLIFAKSIMGTLGDASLVDKAYPFVIIYVLSFVPGMVHMVGSGLLESTNRATPVLILALITNLLNFLVNYGLIYGYGLFPEMGVIGAAYATLIVRIFMAVAISLYILTISDAKRYNIPSLSMNAFKKWKELWFLGIMAALAIAAEGGGFAIVGMLSTKLNVIEANAWLATGRYMGMVFMFGLGLGAATAVRVGIARGRKDYDDQIFALLIGLFITFILIALLSLFVRFEGVFLAQIFTSEVEIITLVAALLSLCLFFFVPDNIQVVLGQSLRTSGVVTPSSVIDIIAYLFLKPLLAIFMTFSDSSAVFGSQFQEDFGYLIDPYFQGEGVFGLLKALIYVSWFVALMKVIVFYFSRKKIHELTMKGA